MDNSNHKNEYVKVQYNAMEDKTYETLDRSVIMADIGSQKLSLSDTIMEFLSCRLTKGKKPNDIVEILFSLNVYTLNSTEPTDKIVLLVDGERLEVNTMSDEVEGTKEISFLPEEMIGLEPGEQFVAEIRGIWFALQPEDIKRIADAKDVKLYIDATTLHDVNGGAIKFRNGNGSFQIEGLQGAMKRAYHFFVDETCYEDYCNSYYERAKKVRAELAAPIEERERKRKEKETEEEELWYKIRRRNLIILLASIAFIVLCVIIGWDTWLIIAAGVLGLYGLYRLYSIGAIRGSEDDEDNEEDEEDEEDEE